MTPAPAQDTRHRYRLELVRLGEAGADWQGHAFEGALAVAVAAGDSPGTVLEELALELDRLETEAIVADARAGRRHPPARGGPRAPAPNTTPTTNELADPVSDWDARAWPKEEDPDD